MKSLTSNLIAARNALAGSAPWIWLVKLEIYYGGSLQDTYYWTSCDVDVEWDNQTWEAFPLAVSLPEESEGGGAPQGELALGNADRVAQALLDSYGGLVGSKVTLYLVNHDYLSNTADKLEFSFEVLEAFESAPAVRLALGSPADIQGIYLPGRKLLPDYCQWKYKEDGCYEGDSKPSGFAHDDEDCDKTLNGTKGCKYHNNAGRFGAFPGCKAGAD